MNFKFYWINIDSSFHRKEFMENQFNKFNINNKRISAITPDDFPEILEDEPPYYCGNTCCLLNNCNDCKFEYACICSHLKAIKEGFDEGLEYFIICEDDILFPFEINFDFLIKQLPQNFHILQMMVLDDKANELLYNHYKSTNELFVRFNPNLHFFSTGMYLISRDGASNLLNKMINKTSLKFDFSQSSTLKQADFLLYLNSNTITTTFPLCIPNIKLISEIHPQHFHLHKQAILKMLDIMNDNINHPLIKNVNLRRKINYYWINLEKAIERREFMEKQFENLNNKRICAITPDDLNDILEDQPPFFCGYKECLENNCKNCPYEYATICSHLEAIKQGYIDGNDYFVVCEDDIILDFKIDFDKIIANIPNDYEILQMMVISKSHLEFLYQNCYKNNSYFVKYTPITPSAAFYLISRKGAEIILEKYINKTTNKWDIEEFNSLKVADVLLFQSVNTCVSTFPLCSFNINFKSQIHDFHFEAHNDAYLMIKEIHKDYHNNPFILT